MRVVFCSLLACLGFSSALAAPAMEIDGLCGGPTTVTITGTTNYQVYFGDLASQTIEEGDCAGYTVGVTGGVSGVLTAGTVSFVMPNSLCGKTAQIIDLVTCETTDLQTLPTEDAFDAGYADGYADGTLECLDEGGPIWDAISEAYDDGYEAGAEGSCVDSGACLDDSDWSAAEVGVPYGSAPAATCASLNTYFVEQSEDFPTVEDRLNLCTATAAASPDTAWGELVTACPLTCGACAVNYAASLCAAGEYWDGTVCTTLHLVEDTTGDDYDDESFAAGVESVDITTDNESYAASYAASLCAAGEYWDGTVCTTLHLVEDTTGDDYDDESFAAGVESVDITTDNESYAASLCAAGEYWDGTVCTTLHLVEDTTGDDYDDESFDAGADSVSAAYCGFGTSWDGETCVGDNSVVCAPRDQDVTDVHAGYLAWALEMEDGSIQPVGSTGYGYSFSSDVIESPALAGPFTTVVSSESGAAALRPDGSVVAWSSYAGIFDTADFPVLMDYVFEQLFAGGMCFAGLTAERDLVFFGSEEGDPCSDLAPITLPEGADLQTDPNIGFRYLTTDGEIVVIGEDFGSNVLVSDSGPIVETIQPASWGFVAGLTAEGMLVVWNLECGFGSEAVCLHDPYATPEAPSWYSEEEAAAWLARFTVPPAGSLDSGVVAFQEYNGQHFIAQKDDGSLISWGLDMSDEVDGLPIDGDEWAISGCSISGSASFAALQDDGMLVAWGGAGYCDAPPEVNDGVKLVSGAETSAYGIGHAVLRETGEVATWNYCLASADTEDGAYYEAMYGPCVPLSDADNYGFADVLTNGVAFLGIRGDGSMVGWGHENFGVDIPLLDLGAGVVSVHEGLGQWAAKTADGGVSVWGLGIRDSDCPAGVCNFCSDTTSDAFWESIWNAPGASEFCGDGMYYDGYYGRCRMEPGALCGAGTYWDYETEVCRASGM